MIFTKLLQGLKPETFEKKNAKIAESLMRQWVEKKVFRFVTPVLIMLWKDNDLGKWTGAVSSTLESANPVVKGAFWGFLTEIATTDPAKAKGEWPKLLKSGEVLESAIADTDNRNTDTKKAAIKFICTVSIFMAKDKDKKHIKKVNAMKDEDPKKKKAIEDEEKGMKETMRANAKALKAKKQPPKPAGDDEKEPP